MNDRIYIDIEDIVDEAKRRSQLKARSLPEGVSTVAIINDSDEGTLDIFLEDGVTDIADRLGDLGELEKYQEMIIHKLDDEQTEQQWKKAENLLKQALVNYVLFQWFRSVNMNELAQEFLAIYDRKATDYRTNSTQDSFIKPNWRPYF